MLAVGDVVGHDLRAARTMALLRHAVRAYAVQDPRPVAVVENVDRLMAVLAPEEFATLLYLVAEPASGHVLYTNAGHPPPLVLNPGVDPQYLAGGVDPPVGYLPPSPYQQQEWVLPRSATVLLYTDGLVEQRDQGIDDGLARLRHAARGAVPTPEHLLAAIEAALVTERPGDDVAMIALMRNP